MALFWDTTSRIVGANEAIRDKVRLSIQTPEKPALDPMRLRYSVAGGQ